VRPQPINVTARIVDYTGEEGEVIRCLALVPDERSARVASRQYPQGTEHTIMPYEPRNMAMHRACMAELNELWQNLPEAIWYVCDADGKLSRDEHGNAIVRFPTMDHFRYWLLIEEGFCTEWFLECKNARAAVATARSLRLRLTHAHIRIDGDRILVREAESQAVDGSMTSGKFKDSMDAILARARSYVGVGKTVSQRHARNA
jgi:hypothetical protein